MSTERSSESRRPRLFRGVLLIGVLYSALVTSYVLAIPFLWSRRSLRFSAIAVSKLFVPLSLWAAGVRLRSQGHEHLDSLGDGPYILISNHEATIDTLVQMQVMKRADISYLAKKEILRRPFLGRLLTAVGWISVDRESPVAAKRVLEEIKAKRKGNWVPRLAIFPEGTRTRDGKMQPFRHGAFLLALQLGIPLLPMVIRGTYGVQQANSICVCPGPVDVFIAEPIFPSKDFPPEMIIEAAEELKNQVETVFHPYLEAAPEEAATE